MPMSPSSRFCQSRTLLRGAQPGAGAAKAPPRHHAGPEAGGVRLEAAVLGSHAGRLQEVAVAAPMS